MARTLCTRLSATTVRARIPGPAVTLEGVSMSHRKGSALLAASALLACAGLVRAAEPQVDVPATVSGLSLSNPVYLADTGPADTSLMGVADKLGVGKPLNDFGLTIGGDVELGTTYTFRNPPVNQGRVFAFENQDPTLHQAVIYIDKPVDFKKNTQF